MIQPPFTEAHEELGARAREFVLGELRPHADEWEAAGWFPNEVFGALAAHGWLGLKYAGDPVADAVLAEELARCGSGGVAAGIGAHVHIATPPIFGFGTEAQRALARDLARDPRALAGAVTKSPAQATEHADLSALGCWHTPKVRLTDLYGFGRRWDSSRHAWSHCAQPLPPRR